MEWYKIYSAHKCDNFAINKKIKKKKILINLVRKYTNNGRILEAGCGTAIVSSYLSQFYDTYAIDIDSKMVSYAKDISINNFQDKNNIKIGNIKEIEFDNKFFDVTFSNGVLEHFENNTIIEIINEEIRVSKIVIVSIPSSYFSQKEAIFGDERFLKRKEWKNIILKTKCKIIEETSFSDTSLLKRFIKIRKWFKPKPFFVFVLAEK